jgi:IS5 family transposase
MKSEHRLERNRLKGQAGDAINALLSAAAMNFSKLAAWVRHRLAFLHALFSNLPLCSVHTHLSRFGEFFRTD